MKGIKIFSLIVAAAILLTPACALAKTHFSFSLNLFERLPICAPAPVFVAPLPPPVYVCPPPTPIIPYYPQRTIVKEYHHYHVCPVQPAPEALYPN